MELGFLVVITMEMLTEAAKRKKNRKNKRRKNYEDYIKRRICKGIQRSKVSV